MLLRRILLDSKFIYLHVAYFTEAKPVRTHPPISLFVCCFFSASRPKFVHARMHA